MTKDTFVEHNNKRFKVTNTHENGLDFVTQRIQDDRHFTQHQKDVLKEVATLASGANPSPVYEYEVNDKGEYVDEAPVPDSAKGENN